MTEETSFITEEKKTKETKRDNGSKTSFEWRNILILVSPSSTLSFTGITKNGLTSYLGIPYALPPVADRRLRPPVPHQMWTNPESSETFSATKSRAGCLSGVEQLMQENFGVDFSDEERSEDCLYMNIWTPENINKDEKLPVLFFIHGGSFLSGNASRFETVGDDVARDENIIVVSIQYRLGIYGFGYLGRDRSEKIGHFEQGNFALQDVRLALKTIYANIYRFGGDAEQITVMGNSAGGLTVATLLSDEAPGMGS
ncbi:unnamed protein product [Oikopleura dioica]|uniref:Carboxylic ester hydrolase n=1 Tax=Oikopleura dioica TaxID=34765 RepID=E4YHV7_OIKDI|nr:unnamed protein product [Oikopleura dioica]